MGRMSLGKKPENEATGQETAIKGILLGWRKAYLYDKEARTELQARVKDSSTSGKEKNQERQFQMPIRKKSVDLPYSDDPDDEGLKRFKDSDKVFASKIN